VHVRRLVPHAVRRGVSAQLARVRAARRSRALQSLASTDETIVAGPWLGEVGFELLYWIPFLAWFAERFDVDAGRMLVVSRGGVAAWYRPFAAGYREIFDQLSPDEFRRRHDERVAANGEQKQTRVLAFEHDLLQQLTTDVRHRTMLHPSMMYELFAPFWWGHVDVGWVHRFARYRRLEAPAIDTPAIPAEPYTAVKFYFNDCFPPSADNRAFVRDVLNTLAARGPVVSLSTGLQLDDHGCDVESLGVRTIEQHVDPRRNLAVQSAIVARAQAFVGTYGGFSYLAPFHGVPSTAYFADPAGFSRRHLEVARSAFARLGVDDLFQAVPAIPGSAVMS
jgi:hypothetical protein